MKKFSLRILSWVLAVLMLVSVMPTSVFAESDSGNIYIDADGNVIKLPPNVTIINSDDIDEPDAGGKDLSEPEADLKAEEPEDYPEPEDKLEPPSPGEASVTPDNAENEIATVSTGVAKVGETGYATIDEAIDNWTNGTTLTLLADVTLSDVVTLKSTEHHTLNLGTYTMTAASGKNAIEIKSIGKGDRGETGALTITADANTPGSINAGSKSCVYYKYDTTLANDQYDRPIIYIKGGVFEGNSYSGISSSGHEEAQDKCATFNISGGTFNCGVNLTKAKLIVSGGTFNGSLSCTGGSTSHRLISGGTFKSFDFMTADSKNTKFWFGTSMAKSDVGVYVDDNGYIVVGGPVVTEAGETFEAYSANYRGANSLLQYSSAKDNGLYYTSVEQALADNNKSTGSVTVYVDELDMSGISYKGTIVVPVESKLTITNAPANLKVTNEAGVTLTPNANGSYTTVTPKGNNFTGYTSTDAIWGEAWGNASESFVIKVLDANGNVMGTTSLNNVGGIIDGDVGVTWSLKLDAASNTDEYWTMSWTTAPTINNQPAKVELWVDGVKVSGGNVVLNGPDEINKIVAATTDANGKILAYHTTLQAAINAAQSCGIVTILRNVTESFAAIENVTLTTNVEDGVTITSTYDDYVDFNNVIVKSGITLNIPYVYSSGNNSVNVIEGTLNVSSTYYHSNDAKTTIQNGGKVTTGGMTVLRYNDTADAGIYIYGDGNKDTVEFSCGDTIGAYSGTFYAKDAVVEANMLWLDYKKNSTEESDAYSQINAEFVNSTLNIASEFRFYKDASLTLNASAVSAGKVQVRENATPTVVADSASSIKAASVQNLSGAKLNAVLDNEGNVSFTVTGLIGMGTQADPYKIGTKAELFYFAKKVNDGTYKNVYVVLIDNIDLEQEDWISIGTSANPFTGTFDGNGKTIYNVWSYERGLFGFTSTGNYVDSGMNGRATIKNLTLSGVEIYNQTTSAIGGVVGQAGQNTEISNVTVTGYISIYGYGYVGGIVGQGYVHIDNCQVIGENNENGDKSTIDANYWAVGGIVGHAGSEGGTSITNCSVKNITLHSAYYGAGAIAGVGTTGPIENVSAESVSVIAVSTPDANGLLVGCNYDKITGNSTVKDVVLEVAGAVVTNPQDMAASVGGNFYVSLSAAVNAAQDGATITVLNNVTEEIQIPDGKTVVIDLNGKTLTGCFKPFKGTLTVKNGTIDNNNSKYSAIEINNGKLTLENVNVTSVRHGVRIDGEVTAVINGGTYKVDASSGTRHAVNVSGNATVTIIDGTFVGPKGTTMDSGAAVNVQTGAKVKIEGGNFSGGKRNTLSASDKTLTVYGGTFDQDPSAYLASQYRSFKIAEGKFIVLKGLAGSGTEAEPYQIGSVEELNSFRFFVNAGDTTYNAPGVYVVLTANIDMEGATWERGIGDGINATFDGIFDGKNFTIKNLNFAPKADGDGYLCGGLFGYTHGAAVIKNLVLENITVKTEDAGHNVGALVGFAYNKGGKLTVSNVTVKNVTIDAPNAYGVGAIVGYSYLTMGTIENCTVEGATIKGYSFVGGITGYSYTDAIISGCTVNNATITATSKGAGGIAGLALNGNITDNTVSNTTVTASTNWGYVVGELGESKVALSNNTAAEPQIGGDYKTGEAYQAKIGNKYYTSIAVAIAAANAGETVVLVNDCTVASIDATDANIDLNGKTLTLTAGGTNFFGNSTVKNGKINITGCVAKGDCIIGIGDYSNSATLNLNGVNITGDGYNSAYAVLYVYNSSTLNINGGSIVVANDNASAGGVIKAHSAANGKINITGTATDPVELKFTNAKIGILDGTVVMDYVDLDIEGGANAINQSALTVKNSTLTIKNADGRALTLSQGDVVIINSDLDFSGCTEGEIRFKKALTLNVDADSTIAECDIWSDVSSGAKVNDTEVTGTEKVPSTIDNATVTNPAWSAKVGSVYYMTLAEAIAAAKAGETVTILAGNYTGNLNVNKAITVVGETDAEGINLVNIAGKLNITADVAAVKNLNVKNSGTACYIGAKNVLVEGCTLVGSNGLYQSYTSGKVTFKDSTITGATYGIHFDGSASGNIVIDNCVITGWTSFAGTINNVTISKTEFAKGNYNQLRFYQDVELTNVKFNPNMTVDFGTGNVEATFNGCSVTDGSSLLDVIYLPDIAQMGVEVKIDDAPVVVEAMIGNTAYLTIEEALNKAQNGDTIVLYVPYVIENGATVAIDLTGKTLEGSILAPNADLTIKGGKIVNNDKSVSAVEINGGKLTLENVDIDSARHAVRIDGAVEATINGGTYRSAIGNGTGTYHALNVSGGANVTIENGTFKGPKGTSADSGSAVNVKAGSTITINGGNFSGGKRNTLASDGKLTVYGGTFDQDPTKYVDTTSYKVVKKDGKYEVKQIVRLKIVVTPVTPMAIREDTIYVATMDEAVAKALEKDADYVVYQIAGPVELTTGFAHGILDLGKNVIIEGVTSDAKLTIVGGGVPDIKGVTFKNITLADEGTYLPTANEFMYQNYIDCTFENVTFVDGIRVSGKTTITDCKVDANTANEYAIWLDEGEFTMTGTTVTAGNDAYGLIKSDEVDKITITGNTFRYFGNANKEALNVKGATIVANGNKFIDCTKGIIPADKTNYAADGTTVLTNEALAGANDVIIYVAKIGDKYFETLDAAFAAIGDGYVVIELLADATLDYNARDAYGTAGTTSVTINGNGHTLTLNQKNNDWASIGLANADAKLVLKNMTIEKTGYGDTTGAWNTHAIIFSCNVEMTDVTVNNSVAVQNGATLTNVTINEANGYYGLWINGNGQTVTMNGGAINATNGGRGIKIADQYVGTPAEVTLAVTGTKFNTAKKAAVLVSSTAGATITATNVDITNVVADSTNVAWVDEAWATSFGNVTVNGAPAAQENASAFTVAIVDSNDKVVAYYKTLAEAFAAAVDGYTIKMVNDVTVSEGITNTKKVTLDLNGKTITGTDNSTGSFAIITNKGELTITGNGTITLKATNNRGWSAYSSVISNTVGGKLKVESGTIEHLGGTDMAYAVDNLTNGKGTYAETVINGGTIKSTYRAIRQFLNGVEAQNILTINGGTIEGANKSVWMQDPSANANSGKLTIGANASIKGDIYLTVTAGSTEWPVEFSIAAAALKDGSTVLTTNVPAQVAVVKVNGVYSNVKAVASVNGVGYATLAEAIAAAKAGDTVTVYEGTYAVPSMKAGITIEGVGNVLLEGTLSGTLENLTLKNLHIKGSNAQRWAYAKGDLVFENVTFEATSVYALHFDGITAGTNLTYKNCTIIGWAAMGGSPASCVFDGCTIKGNGTYGLIRTYFNTTIKDCTFDVANVNTNDVYQDGIHAVEGAKVTVTNCTNANGAMADIVNVHARSVVDLDGVEIKNVAKIGDKYYLILTEAIAAITDGCTLTIFEGTYDASLVINKKDVTVIGEGDVTLNGTPSIKGTNYKVENIDFVYTTGSTNLSGSGLIKDCTFAADNNTFRYCYGTKDAAITFEGCTISAPNGWAIHFDSAPGLALTLTNCKITGRVALGGDLGSLTATGTTFADAYVNVWGTKDGAKFADCGFVNVPYIFTGYDADNTFNFNNCTVTENGATKNVTDIIYGGNDAAEAEIYVDGALKSGVAKIGDTYYKTLAEAVAAAAANAEIVILKAGTYSVPTGKNLTITGAVAGVVFDNIGACGMGGANVTFNNVTFNYAANSTYKGLQHAGEMVYNNCIINGQVFLYGTSETFNNCTFNQTSSDAYNVWTYGAKEVAFNECTFNSVGKSVLIYAESASITNDVTVTDCDFIASAPADGKAAIEMDSSLTSGIKLTIDAATTATGFGTGNVSGNSLWNNKKDNKTDANNDITVVVNGETVLAPVTFTVAIGADKYATLAEAIAAAQAGDTIKFLADITEDVTITKDLTIDGDKYNYTGKMTLNKVNVTIQNVDFIKGSIYKHKNTGAGGDFTIKNCTFDGQGLNDYAINLGGTDDIVIEDCTANNYGYGFLQVSASNASVTVKNVVVTNVNYGFKIDYSNGVTLENVTVMNAEYYGIYDSNFGTKTYTITNCKLEAIKIWERAAAKTTTFEFVGTNAVTTLDASNYAKYVLADVNATLTAPEGQTVTTDVADYSVKYADGKYFVKANVVAIGEKTYETLAKALAAAKAGDTITLLADITEDVTISKAVTIDGAGKTYTGAMTLKADTTIKNVNFDGKGYNGYAITTRGAQYLTIEDCTAKNYVYGFVQLASGTALTTVKNVTISNMNYGVKVDYSNAVVLENADITVGVAAVLNSNYGEKTITIKNSKLNILGTWTRNSTVKTNYVFEGANTIDQFVIDATIDNFKLADNATLTAPNSITVTTDVTNAKVVYENGTYKVVAIIYVAEVNGVKYEKLAEAINNATAGQTITLLADVTENVTINKNITIDGGNFKYTGTMTANAGLTITIQNVNFVNGGIDKPKAQKSATGIYTIKNCTFDGEGEFAYAFRFYGANTVTIENCTVKDYLYSFLYIVSGTNTVSVKNVTVEDCPNYAVYFASGVNNATVENLTVKNSNNGFIINNSANRTLTIKDCKMENVDIAVDYSKGTNTITCNVLGQNDFGCAKPGEYTKYVLAEATATLTAHANYKVTTNVADHNVVYEDGTYKLVALPFVAQIGDKQYTSLAEAIKKAQSGDTIKIIADHELDGSTYVTGTYGYDNLIVISGKTLIIDFNGKTITVTPNAPDANGGLKGIIESIIFIEKGANLTLNGEGGFKVNKGTGLYSLIYNSGSTLTIESGNYIVEEMVTAASIIYAEGNHTTVVNGGNFRLGNAAQDPSSTKPWIFNTEGKNDSFIQVNGGTFNQNILMHYGTQKDCEVDLADGWCLHLNQGNGIWTVVEGHTAGAPVEEKRVEATFTEAGSYEEVVYCTVCGVEISRTKKTIDALGAVAQIGDKQYTSLAEALAAAPAGDIKTVVLRANVDEIYTVIPAGITLDLNGWTITTSYLASFGSIIDGTEGGHGMIKTAMNSAVVRGDSEFVPLYDNVEGAYKFFYVTKFAGYKPETNKDQNDVIVQVTYAVDLKFANGDAYKIIAAGNSGLKLNFNLTFNVPGRESHIFKLGFSDNALMNYAKERIAFYENPDNADKYFTAQMTVTGFNAEDNHISSAVMIPAVESVTGYTHNFKAKIVEYN